MQKTKVTRREFLKSAAQAGAVLAVPMIVPASVLGKNGAVPPSEKIVVGGHRPPGPRHGRLAVDDGRARRAVRRHLRPAEEAARGGQEDRRQPLRQPGLQDVPRHPRASWPSGRTSTRC